MAGTAAVASAIVGAVGIKDARDARKDQKKLAKKAEDKSNALQKAETEERFNKRRREADQAKGIQRRGAQRGRMSTILGQGQGGGGL